MNQCPNYKTQLVQEENKVPFKDIKNLLTISLFRESVEVRKNNVFKYLLYPL